MSFTRSHSIGAPVAIGPFRFRTRPLALWLLLLLALQFLLGMVTNLYVPIPASHPGSNADNYFVGVLQGLGWAMTHGEWALQLHVLMGLWLILMSFALIGVAYRAHERVWMISAPISVFGMLVAGFNGASFINYGQNLSSLLMSVGFLTALVALLVGLYLTPRMAA